MLEEKIKALENEIKMINSPAVRRFVTQALENADPGFWTVPSSSSGKYHPPEDQGEGGLIRHVKKTVVVCREYARMMNFEAWESNCAIAASLLHDIKKNWNGSEWTDQTDYRHGMFGAGWLKQFWLYDATRKKVILDAVRYHMGQWCTTLGYEKMKAVYSKDKSFMLSAEEFAAEIKERTRSLQPNKVEYAVQIADYFASRKDISFLPGMTIMPEERHDSP